MKPVKDYEYTDSVKDLVKKMNESGGFQSAKLGKAAQIFKKMTEKPDCTTFLSFPACIAATGTRGILKQLVKENKVDSVITTCGTLDHDLARIWKDYYQGKFQSDDAELHQQGVNRLGNVYVPNESYGEVLENKMQSILKKLYKEKKEWSTQELIDRFGKEVADAENAEESIIYWCHKNNIPVIVPGFTDGAFGSQLWMFWQKHKDFKINAFKDEHQLSDTVFDAEETGALLIGGGISKHHVIWWNQFRNGLDHAVGITTANEYDGSLSGAKVSEAVSWGKVKEEADYITVHGDATILLPLVVSQVL